MAATRFKDVASDPHEMEESLPADPFLIRVINPWIVVVLAAGLAAFLSACATTQPDAPSEAPSSVEAQYDLVIIGGKLVDGTGNPWRYGDVGVRGDEIVFIGPAGALDEATAERRIDANGHVVTPGFIDPLGHSRGALIEGDSRLVNKVTQGITTEIMGEGTTDAPVNRALLERDGLLDEERIAWRLERFGGPRGFDGWLRHMEERGASVNMGSFVGASTIRGYVMGESDRTPTAAELDTMRALVERAMEDGAMGIGSSLIYTPATYASTDELVAIAEVIAPYGGVYSTHIRSEGDRLLEGIEEAIEIGERAGVTVEIHHLKAAGERNWQKAEESFALIDEARENGVDVQANVYPYPAAGTGLASCLPPWVPTEGRSEILQDPEQRERIREEMLDPEKEWEDLCELATPEGVTVLDLDEPHNEQWVGRRLAEVADAMDQHWVETLMDLVAEEGWIFSIFHLMSPENVERTIQQPWIKFSTDAGGQDPEEATGLTHPRAYGTYPRVLGKYVRDDEALSLEEAVRKATSAVATLLSIPDRGLLKEGMKADIVVFDPEAVTDHATFEDPHQLSTGIEYVFVNGTPVVWEGEHTGEKPGQVVRGPGYNVVEVPEPPVPATSQ